MISVNYGFGGGVITVTNAKSSAGSEKFTLKIRSESGKLFTIGCHSPPKSTNFGTLGGGGGVRGEEVNWAPGRRQWQHGGISRDRCDGGTGHCVD